MWDLSCPDWEDRIREGRSLMPDLPLFESEANEALQIFDELVLPDVPGLPKMREACGEWFREIVRAAAGSRNPETNERMIREIFALVPKGQSKTTYSSGLMIVAMLMNLRPLTEALFVGPTQAIADLAYEQAAGMIEADPALSKRFQTIPHKKTISDRVNKAKLKVKTFDLKILTGTRPVIVLLDEIHLLGRNPHAAKVLRQIRGGLEKNPEGLLIIITTQSDEMPAGIFRDELIAARKVRDGKGGASAGRAVLPILYEFPADIAKDPFKWQDPHYWPMVLPNLGRSMWIDSLTRDWNTERGKGEHAIRIWASQHLNIEIGIGLKTDAWEGAEYWGRGANPELTLKTIIERCEVIVVGIDGGGLDDLFGLTVLGREKDTKKWLSWTHAWAHKSVLERRQTIAPVLRDFEEAGDLTIVDDALDDLTEIVAVVDQINQAGLLACVAIDSEGPFGEFVDALDEIGVNEESEQIVGVGQGYKLMNAIKTSARKLVNGTLLHNGSTMMDWCVGNIKIEPTATGIRASKQNAGDAKIDPVMSLFDACTIMSRNPVVVGPSVYASRGALVL